MKVRKTQALRVRCDDALKTDLETVARIDRLDTSDIVRIACASYVHERLRNVVKIVNHGER